MVDFPSQTASTSSDVGANWAAATSARHPASKSNVWPRVPVQSEAGVDENGEELLDPDASEDRNASTDAALVADVELVALVPLVASAEHVLEPRIHHRRGTSHPAGDGKMVIQAALLGLSTGLYCATACFPILISACFSRTANGWMGTAKGVGQFLMGRLVAYLIVGALAGLAGFFLGRFHTVSDLLVSLVYLVSGGLMAVYGIVESFPHAKAYMIPFFFSGLAAKKVYVRKAARIISIAMGIWFVWVGGVPSHAESPG